MSTPDLSAESFARLAADLQQESHDTELTAQAVVGRMRDLVPDADDVSLTVTGPRGAATTVAATSDWAIELDALQYDLDQGPCLEAAERTGETRAGIVRSGDVGRDRRWPLWGPQAARRGAGSLLAVQMLEGDRISGALNLYCRETGRFDDADLVDTAQVYALHCATALTAARTVANLQTALTSRHTIGMAQGVIMARFGLDPERSFEFLRRLSSTRNVKLRDVAAQVVAAVERDGVRGLDGQVGDPDREREPG